MGKDIPTLNHLLQYQGENVGLIEIQVDAFQLAETNEVCPDENTKLATFLFSDMAVTRVALELQADPKFIHFDEIGEDERDTVPQIAGGCVGVANGEVISCLAGEVVSEEQAADGVLNATAHFEHVPHDFTDGGFGNAHVDTSQVSFSMAMKRVEKDAFRR